MLCGDFEVCVDLWVYVPQGLLRILDFSVCLLMWCWLFWITMQTCIVCDWLRVVLQVCLLDCLFYVVFYCYLPSWGGCWVVMLQLVFDCVCFIFVVDL